MKSVLYKPKPDGLSVQVADVELPPLASGHVLVQVAFCGICGSDVRRHRTFTQNGVSTSEPIPTPGHEFSGAVTSLGEGVTVAQVGDHVVINPLIGCGDCESCRTGKINCCRRGVEVIGYHQAGGFAEYCQIPQENLVATSMPLDSTGHAAFSEPLAVAVNAAEHATCDDANQGQVLVIGDGVIGVLTAWVLKNIHNRDVVVLGRRDHRILIAKSLGIKACSNDQLSSQTQDGQVSTVVVASGSQSGLSRGLELLPKRGQLIFLGYLGENDPGLNSSQMNHIVRSEITVVGSFGYGRECFQKAVRILESGELDTGLLVDRVIGLGQVAELLKLLVVGKVDGLKVIVDPKM